MQHPHICTPAVSDLSHDPTPAESFGSARPPVILSQETDEMASSSTQPPNSRDLEVFAWGASTPSTQVVHREPTLKTTTDRDRVHSPAVPSPSPSPSRPTSLCQGPFSTSQVACCSSPPAVISQSPGDCLELERSQNQPESVNSSSSPQRSDSDALAATGRRTGALIPTSDAASPRPREAPSSHTETPLTEEGPARKPVPHHTAALASSSGLPCLHTNDRMMHVYKKLESLMHKFLVSSEKGRSPRRCTIHHHAISYLMQRAMERDLWRSLCVTDYYFCAFLATTPRGTGKVMKSIKDGAEVQVVMKAVSQWIRSSTPGEALEKLIHPIKENHLWEIQQSVRHRNLATVVEVFTLLAPPQSYLDSSTSFSSDSAAADEPLAPLHYEGTNEVPAHVDGTLHGLATRGIYVMLYCRQYVANAKSLHEAVEHVVKLRAQDQEKKRAASDQAPLSPMTRDTLADILWQVASCLEHLHEENFAHGNLKPSNILLYGDNYDSVLLTDSGIPMFPTSFVKERVAGVGVNEGKYYVRLRDDIYPRVLFNYGSNAPLATTRMHTTTEAGSAAAGDQMDSCQYNLLYHLAAPEALAFMVGFPDPTTRPTTPSVADRTVWVQEDLLWTPAADAYALGVILYMLVYASYPSRPILGKLQNTDTGVASDNKMYRLTPHHQRRVRMPPLATHEAPLRDLIKGLLYPKPAKRLTMKEMRTSTFFHVNGRYREPHGSTSDEQPGAQEQKPSDTSGGCKGTPTVAHDDPALLFPPNTRTHQLLVEPDDTAWGNARRLFSSMPIRLTCVWFVAVAAARLRRRAQFRRWKLFVSATVGPMPSVARSSTPSTGSSPSRGTLSSPAVHPTQSPSDWEESMG